MNVSSVSHYVTGLGAHAEGYSKNIQVGSFQRENLQVLDRVNIRSRNLPGQDAGLERTDESAIYEINGKHRQLNMNRAENGINWSFFQEMCFTSIEQTGVDINNIVSMYLTYKEFIQDNFTGEERDAQMAKLHELTSGAMERLANGFSDDMGDFLEKYGLTGEKSILKESVYLWFEEILAENSDAFLKEKSEASLSDFGLAVSSEEFAVFYSKDDINALIQLRMSTDSSIAGVSGAFKRENFPIGFLNFAMQKEAIYDAFSVSDFAKEKMETVFYGRVDEVIDERNDSYDKKLQRLLDRYGSVTEDQLERYAHFDKELIRQLIGSFLGSVKSGMQAEDAYEKTDYFQGLVAGESKEGLNNGNSSPVGGFKYFMPELGRSDRSININLPTSRKWIA